MSTQYYFRKWGGEATTAHRSSGGDTFSTANHPQIRSYSGWILKDDPWVLTDGRSNGNNKTFILSLFAFQLKKEVPWYEF